MLMDFVSTYIRLMCAEQEMNPVARTFLYIYGKEGLFVSLMFEILTVSVVCYLMYIAGLRKMLAATLASLTILHIVGFLSTLSIYIIPIPILNIALTLLLAAALLQELYK